MSRRNIDAAWDCLDREYRIRDTIERESFAVVTAQQMHEMRSKIEYAYVKFEPRLLTHFDNNNQQPTLFKQNGLSILPSTRGTYVIGQFDPFMKIDGANDYDNIETKRLPSKGNWSSLSASLLFNEAMGLNFAEANGILSDFVGEELTATVAGRQSGGTWTYWVESNGERTELRAENPQIEIDGGYEGETQLVLVEAKNSLVEEFCLRQLYFPFRAWLERVDKPVRTIFAAINGLDIYLYEYAFPDPYLFKAELVKCCKYQVVSDSISKEEVLSIFGEVEVCSEPTVTFPQADSPSRTIDVIYQLLHVDIENGEANGMTAAEISEHYGIHRRQGNYYGDAAAYFGYAEKSSNGAPYLPTALAYEYAALDSSKLRKLHVCRELLKRPVFHAAFGHYVSTGQQMSKPEIASLIAKYTTLSKGTPERRSGTVSSWIKWIISLWQE